MIQDIEASLNFVENKYSLVLVASRRARSISLGAKSFMAKNDIKNIKPSEVSIKEIASGVINSTNFSLSHIDPTFSTSGEDGRSSADKTGGITRFKKFITSADNSGAQYENVEEDDF